jgi:hypothetical protein
MRLVTDALNLFVVYTFSVQFHSFTGSFVLYSDYRSELGGLRYCFRRAWIARHFPLVLHAAIIAVNFENFYSICDAPGLNMVQVPAMLTDFYV